MKIIGGPIALDPAVSDPHQFNDSQTFATRIGNAASSRIDRPMNPCRPQAAAPTWMLDRPAHSLAGLNDCPKSRDSRSLCSDEGCRIGAMSDRPLFDV